MRDYEAVLIVDPRLEEPAIKQAISKIRSAIESAGEVKDLDEWGRRRFAYEIDHLNEGHYVAFSFKAEPEAVAEVNRTIQLGEEYLRGKVVKLPDGYEPPARTRPPEGGGGRSRSQSSPPSPRTKPQPQKEVGTEPRTKDETDEDEG